jgi:hypothetical protein
LALDKRKTFAPARPANVNCATFAEKNNPKVGDGPAGQAFLIQAGGGSQVKAVL